MGPLRLGREWIRTWWSRGEASIGEWNRVVPIIYCGAWWQWFGYISCPGQPERTWRQQMNGVHSGDEVGPRIYNGGQRRVRFCSWVNSSGPSIRSYSPVVLCKNGQVCAHMCTCAGECVYMSSMCMCECVFIQTQIGGVPWGGCS